MSQPTLRADTLRIGVRGLGYVELPVAVAFDDRFSVVGFDTNAAHIETFRGGEDPSREVSAESIAASSGLVFSSDRHELADCNVYIVAVPMPVDAGKRPNTSHLQAASETVGRVVSCWGWLSRKTAPM